MLCELRLKSKADGAQTAKPTEALPNEIANHRQLPNSPISHHTQATHTHYIHLTHPPYFTHKHTWTLHIFHTNHTQAIHTHYTHTSLTHSPYYTHTLHIIHTHSIHHTHTTHHTNHKQSKETSETKFRSWHHLWLLQSKLVEMKIFR